MSKYAERMAQSFKLKLPKYLDATEEAKKILDVLRNEGLIEEIRKEVKAAKKESRQ